LMTSNKGVPLTMRTCVATLVGNQGAEALD
jgi:hypothetical protein